MFTNEYGTGSASEIPQMEFNAVRIRRERERERDKSMLRMANSPGIACLHPHFFQC